MWRYAAVLSYRGTDYCGWQRQMGSAAEGGPSIQGTIEGSLRQLTEEEASVIGSGRTDSGVHAVGQVAHFVLKRKEWDTGILLRGLNAILPQDIQALRIQRVPDSFHAQRSAEKKQYSYYFQQGSCALPHLEPFSWWIRKPLDIAAMQRGLDQLVGEHDFKPFQASGSKPGPTVRRILEADITRVPPGFPGTYPMPGVDFIRVRVLGTGFLKQMIRGIAGTLLQVGESRRDAAVFGEILKSGNRKEVGPTAPARALWLERVWYNGVDLSD